MPLLLFLLWTDYSVGFGGTFGVQSDRVDKSALGWDSVEAAEKHESQMGMLISMCLFFIQTLLKICRL